MLSVMAPEAKGLKSISLRCLEKEDILASITYGIPNSCLQRRTEIQLGSESTAGDPSALPLHIVMQPEARLTGSLGGSLFQLLCYGCKSQVHIEAALGAGLHEWQPILLG